jgi:hypothetical protein
MRSFGSISFVRAFGSSVLAAAIVAFASSAGAQSTERASKLSPYEEARVARAIAKVKGEIDPAPEGKTVDQVLVVPLEVIEEDDPAPGFLNMFHATSRESVLRREVQLDVGDTYLQYRIDESVRVARSFPQLSLVLAVALRGSTPDRVRVLFVTKDVWSLRANFDIKLGANGLDLLRFEPTERNIGGTLTSAVTRFELLPESLTLGAGYYVPRVAGRRIYLINDVNVVLNRESGEPEGSFGRVSVARPVLSSDATTTWSYTTLWSDVNIRRYVGARLATFDAAATPEEDKAPDVFRARTMTQTGSIQLSFGRAHKADVLFGAELSVRQFRGLDPTIYDPRVVAEHTEKRVPTSDDRAAPWAQIRVYESRFIRLHDFDVLGLQEDYRLGYQAWLRVYPVTRALGSSRNFFGFDAAAQYTYPILDGFVSGLVETLAEVQADGVPQLAVGGELGYVGPQFFLGRLVVDSVAIARPRNYVNHRSGLGGEGRLRGYPSAAFLGENVVAYNVELRTRPIEILSCQLGATAFFDVGDAFDNGMPLRPKSSTGFGLRGLFPQLDRKVMRLDVAFPLVRAGDAGPDTGPVGFYIAFEQAFGVGTASGVGNAPAQALIHPIGSALGH